MLLKKDFLLIIVGLGSIGKSHAKNYSAHFNNLIFIDPDENVLPWAKENIKDDFLYFKQLKDCKSHLKSNHLKK